MLLLTFQQLWNRLVEGDESVMLEAKRATEVGKSIIETVSAFSNEPDAGGGYFLFGVTRKTSSLFPDYEIEGVANPDKLQSDLATQCREMFSSPIRPEFATESVHGKIVVVAYIPEAQPHQKPVFITSRGALKGSFRRIGPTDQICTEDDLAIFFQSRGQRSFDETAVEGTSLHDVDQNAITVYRNAREIEDGASDLLRLPDSELLYALNATSDSSPSTTLTLGGLLLFGKASAIRRHLPMTRVDYIRVEGTEWVKNTDRRYQTIEKLGALLVIIPQLINQVLDDIPKAFNLPEGGVHRQDTPLVPRKVIREAIVNALMHRSYRTHQPVQIIRFANRIEIKNPGYSLIPDERLGEPGSKTRNPKIAATLHDAGLAETKGTGVKVMREAMERANLTLPLIESDRVRDEFTLKLLVHHLLGEEDVKWLARFGPCKLSPDEARALIILREIRQIDNATYRQINHLDALTASNHLRRLRDLGLLEQQGRGALTYYVAGPRFFTAISGPQRRKRTSGVPEPLTQGQCQQLDKLRKGLSPELIAELDTLGGRVRPADLNELIHRLCSSQPFNAIELGLMLKRNPEHIRNRNLKRMLADGEISYLYPDDPAHPNQRYVSRDST
jgi:ATP-dependent DNA helicase RecG